MSIYCTYVDFDVWRERLDGERQAGDESSSTDWHQNSVDVRYLVDNLETTRALTGQDVRVIVTAVSSIKHVGGRRS